MIGATLDQRARRIRLVTVEDTEATLDETDSAYFPAHLYSPRDPSSRRDGSPREAAARSRLVFHRKAPALGPASRVELFGDDAVYELLTGIEDLRLGERVEGHQVEVLDVDTLYPLAATVEGLSSADFIPLSLYTGSEESRGHGDYEDYEAEAPVEFAEDLDTDNTVLLIGEQRWRVTSSVIDFQVPHVRMQLRKVS